MRLILILLILFVIACGALFGALNGVRIPLDFYFVRITIPTGVALLGALLAWLGQMPRLRRERRAAGGGHADVASPSSAPTHADA